MEKCANLKMTQERRNCINRIPTMLLRQLLPSHTGWQPLRGEVTCIRKS